MPAHKVMESSSEDPTNEETPNKSSEESSEQQSEEQAGAAAAADDADEEQNDEEEAPAAVPAPPAAAAAAPKAARKPRKSRAKAAAAPQGAAGDVLTIMSGVLSQLFSPQLVAQAQQQALLQPEVAAAAERLGAAGAGGSSGGSGGKVKNKHKPHGPSNYNVVISAALTAFRSAGIEAPMGQVRLKIGGGGVGGRGWGRAAGEPSTELHVRSARVDTSALLVTVNGWDCMTMAGMLL